MKIQISLSTMEPDDYNADVANAEAVLNKAFVKLFDDGYTARAARPKSGILSNSLWISIYNVPTTATDLERLNAKIGMRFVMHLTNGSGKQVPMHKFDLELLTMTREAKDAGYKYRKISGNTPTEAATKFIAWLNKVK